jgi:hypothetical protein
MFTAAISCAVKFFIITSLFVLFKFTSMRFRYPRRPANFFCRFAVAAENIGLSPLSQIALVFTEPRQKNENYAYAKKWVASKHYGTSSHSKTPV